MDAIKASHSPTIAHTHTHPPHHPSTFSRTASEARGRGEERANTEDEERSVRKSIVPIYRISILFFTLLLFVAIIRLFQYLSLSKYSCRENVFETFFFFPLRFYFGLHFPIYLSMGTRSLLFSVLLNNTEVVRNGSNPIREYEYQTRLDNVACGMQ